MICIAMRIVSPFILTSIKTQPFKSFMRKNFKIVAAAFVLFIASCGSSDSPKAVAGNFLKAMNKMDYETAKKYGSEDTGKLLDMMSGFSKMMSDSARQERSFEIKDEKIEGDKATVTYTQSGEEGEQVLNLIRVEGKWKVAMSKDSMNGEEGTSVESGATSTDTTSIVPADSAK